jgi:chromosome segregation ATPase
MELERIAKLEAQVEGIQEDVKDLKADVKEIHSRITTGNREIIDKMDDMQTRIEHKMQANAQISQDQHVSISRQVSEDIDNIKGRVSELEKWKWYVIGAAAALGFLLGNIHKIADFLK